MHSWISKFKHKNGELANNSLTAHFPLAFQTWNALINLKIVIFLIGTLIFDFLTDKIDCRTFFHANFSTEYFFRLFSDDEMKRTAALSVCECEWEAKWIFIMYSVNRAQSTTTQQQQQQRPTKCQWLECYYQYFAQNIRWNGKCGIRTDEGVNTTQYLCRCYSTCLH